MENVYSTVASRILDYQGFGLSRFPSIRGYWHTQEDLTVLVLTPSTYNSI